MKKYGFLVFLMILLAGVISGCGASGKDDKSGRRDIEFTVVAQEKLPQKLLQAIEENKKNEIRMTYTDGEDMYLIRGYGEQKTGGYSITVSECTEDETTILFDTQLIGPSGQEGLSKDPSYPCLVVKIEAREKEVMIQ